MSTSWIRFKLPYRTGTLLAASIMISMALMYAGVVIPTLPQRFDPELVGRLGFLLSVRESLMWVAHGGMFCCGILLLFRKARYVPTAIGLVLLVWALNVTWQIGLDQRELIVPSTGFALFSGLPLVWTWRTSKRRTFPPEAQRKTKRWIPLGETLVAAVILGMALSVAVRFPLGQILSREGPRAEPAGQGGSSQFPPPELPPAQQL